MFSSSVYHKNFLIALSSCGAVFHAVSNSLEIRWRLARHLLESLVETLVETRQRPDGNSLETGGGPWDRWRTPDCFVVQLSRSFIHFSLLIKFVPFLCSPIRPISWLVAPNARRRIFRRGSLSVLSMSWCFWPTRGSAGFSGFQDSQDEIEAVNVFFYWTELRRIMIQSMSNRKMLGNLRPSVLVYLAF